VRKLTTKSAKQSHRKKIHSRSIFAKPSLSFTTEDCSDIPSQQPNTELYIPVPSAQQSGTDRYAEAETYSPQLQHKEYSQHMLVKGMTKQLQILEEFNTASDNSISYKSFLQINYWCEPKINAR